jgi:hypothetical protein
MRVMNACIRFAKSLAALLPWVVVSVLLAVGALALVRSAVPLAVLRENSDVVGNYLQTLSTIFSILLAFVVYMVWGQFNDTRAYVDREANEAMDLWRAIRGFPDSIRVPFESELLAYLDCILDGEWEALARCQDGPLKHGWELLDEMWKTLRTFEPPSEGMSALYSDARERLNDLGDLRTYRITSSRQRVPISLWMLLYLGTLVMVLSTYLMAVESFALHAFMAGSIAGALSHVLYLIWDLDNCFKGYFHVQTTPYRRVRDLIRPPSGTTGPPSLK